MTETTGFQDPKVFQEKLNALAKDASESTKGGQDETTITESEDTGIEEEQAELEVESAADQEKENGDETDDGISSRDKQDRADGDEDGDEDLETPRIPRKRLNKEIDKRRTVEEDLIRTKTKLEAMEAAIAEMFKPQSTQQQQQQGEEIDNIETNIDALDEKAHSLYMKEIKALRGEIQQLKQGNEQNATNQAMSNFKTVVETHYKQYAEKVPDAEKALDYLIKMKQEEASHIYSDEKEAYNAGMRQLQIIADATIRGGKNVAETMYEMAKKHGYRPNAAKGGTPNLAAIEQNRKKSASVSSIPATSASASTGVDWEKMRSKPGGFIDPKAFQAALDRQMKARTVS